MNGDHVGFDFVSSYPVRKMIKFVFNGILCCLCFLGSVQALQPLSRSSGNDRRDAQYGVDGLGTQDSAWVSDAGEEGHWLLLNFEKPKKISEVHLFLGLRAVAGSVIGAGEIQVREGQDWKKVGTFKGNVKEELKVVLEPPVETKEIRLWTAQKAQVAVREMTVHAEPTPLGEGIVFQNFKQHQVSANQTVYNDGAPKRFTVPTAVREGVKFSIRETGVEKPVFSGDVRNGLGDFSQWNAGGNGGSFVIHVEGGGLEPADSFPFEAGPRKIQRTLLQPLVDFLIDGRSVVGTHASGYGGAAWRDGTYYSHELASLVMLSLAFPEEIAKMPRQIDWEVEKAKVLSPDFRFVSSRGDRGIFEAVRFYYSHFEAPAEDAPDVVKLIHWGLGMTLAKPALFDPSGDGIGLQVHSQSVEQVAYVLALQPRLEKWIPASVFAEAKRFVENHWAATGLLKVPSTWDPAKYKKEDDPVLAKMSGPGLNPYKGRHVPGHSILANLLMYEVARRDSSARAIDYLKAAIIQADYVIREMDWNDPRTTKGQRMSEHKMITGLVWLQQNYPKQAPAGLQRKLEQWADVAISRSDNMWDFRRYDLGDHWTIPVMNEPGNLGGFPACALSVSWLIEDPAKKQRLREIAFAALDCLFGRNPINAASPHHPELGWNGMIEKGWPVGFPNGTTARLETCRGALASCPGSEMFPFNPEGKPRFPEGWSAFNAALNVGLSYIEMDSKGIAKLPEDCLKKEE